MEEKITTELDKKKLQREEKIKSEIENGFLPFSYNECKNCAENCT